MVTKAQVAKLFRQFRDHQRKVFASGGGMVVRYTEGRTEMTWGGAPYGEHAISAFVSAKRHAAFIESFPRS